jgi:hypothetical protein
MKPITTEMLLAAAEISDLDEALASVMDQVGITDGGVAGIVFSGDDWRARWPDEHHNSRMAMLWKWVAAEEAMTSDLPPDPEGKNDERAEWAERALITFENATGTDRSDVVTDMLTNMMHWCDRNGQDFEERLAMARVHYEAETQS